MPTATDAKMAANRLMKKARSVRGCGGVCLVTDNNNGMDNASATRKRTNYAALAD